MICIIFYKIFQTFLNTKTRQVAEIALEDKNLPILYHFY